MLDLIHRIDEQKKVTYVWFDTGLEYQATKDHLKYLEDRYAIKIYKYRAEKAIPTCVREFGQPFLSKYISGCLQQLQKYNFDWSDGSFDDLIKRFPNCKYGIRFWCNDYGSNGFNSSMYNINYRKYLKEFIVSNPPTFRISNKCCEYAKKKVAHKLMAETKCDLSIIGVRKCEGGIRSVQYKNCYTQGENSYRPLFWFTNADKLIYVKAFNIKHSDCYCRWGFIRTGCVGCPYNRDVFSDLNVVKNYEPNMYKAANNIFKESYEYTKQYKQFVRDMKDKENGRRRLF